jgi:acetyl esterase
MRRLPRTLLLSLLLLVGLAAPFAHAADCPPVEIRNPEGNYIVPGVRGDIVYRRVDGRELALDAYVQRRVRRRPAVVVIHGGGFTGGSRVAFVGQFLETLTRAGFNWFAVDYRLGGVARYADALADLRAALAFVRCRAGEFQIDPDRIALFGEDTGATLAALLAGEKPAGVRASVLVGGFYDLGAVEALKAQATADLLAQASPAARVAGGMPETLIVHGGADREASPEQATNYCAALNQAGSRCATITIEGAIHRAENWRPEQWGYKARVVRWLSRKLKLDSPDFEPYYGGLRWDRRFVGFVNDEGKRHELRLNLYIPPGEGPFPVVILVHGGGWEAGDKVTYIAPLFEPLAKAGFAWASIDYELTPQVPHQAQIENVRDAINWVRMNAPLSKLDPSRIALVGESASGQMVAQLATGAPRGVAAVVSFYGVYDFVSMAKDAGPRSIPARLFRLHKLDDETRETLRRYSPLHNAKKEMPPLLLICGTRDALFAQHTAFTRRLAEVGARYESFTLDGAPHGMENWEGHPEWAGYKQKLVEWLRANLHR